MRPRVLSQIAVGRTRRAAVAIIAMTVAATMVTGQPASSEAIAASASPQRVSVGVDDVSWHPSGNADLRDIRPRTEDAAVQVKPRRASGRKNISARSGHSSAPVGPAGTTIEASARIRTSQPGRRLVFRVREINAGRVVSSRSVSVIARSTSWRSVSVRLRTVRSGSRIQVYASARRVGDRHLLRLTDVTVRATPPNSDGPVNPPGDPSSQAACEDIDYSDPSQGVLTFSEDFNGTEIDRTKWRVRHNTFLNQDQAWISQDNVSVHDGKLDIVGRRMPQSQWKRNENALYERNVVRDYSTGYVDTIDDAGLGNAAGNRFSQKYGYFEVRALVPSTNSMSRGIWPAFWLRADHRLGEIDPMESYGAPTIRNFDPSPSYEWNSWADTSQKSTKEHTQGRAHPAQDNEPIWKGYHRYGVHWSPTCLRYTYDGTTVGVVPLSSKPYFTGYSFDDTFHIRLNMQIGNNYWGWADPQHTRSEFHYLIDHVRVYQKKAG